MAGLILNPLRLPSIAASIGDVATLIWLLVSSDLVRVSVGLEDWADLEADFSNALADAECSPLSRCK